MAGVISDAGLQSILNVGLRATGSGWGSGRLHLFKNNITPGTATVLADLTEANFTGYAALAFTTADWAAAFAASHLVSCTSTAKNFTITAGTQDIYGWYFTDPTNAVLWASQRDPAAPITMDAAAVNVLTLILTLQLKDIATP